MEMRLKLSIFCLSGKRKTVFILAVWCVLNGLCSSNVYAEERKEPVLHSIAECKKALEGTFQLPNGDRIKIQREAYRYSLIFDGLTKSDYWYDTEMVFMPQKELFEVSNGHEEIPPEIMAELDHVVFCGLESKEKGAFLISGASDGEETHFGLLTGYTNDEIKRVN